ncbi:YSC84-related protein [Nitrosomonas sp. Nm33]|uniref:lipid-binding SYLF domain-containing protein n=1 Tax=Nitrosomonas sp. Nm33 TaxID=133724 RepID=UPI00089D0E52|nr:lipid-binding SYLF domain-containing protein [Nitrosomonas sp. Nm33]SDZ09776.1 Las17-binding protein actin regulator [Nitrosomonas sp. Nm33]
MRTKLTICLILITVSASMLIGCESPGSKQVNPAAAVEIDREVDIALAQLFQTTPEARDLAARAKGILVFPNILKAGFIAGAQYGKGAMRKGRMTTGYYNIVAASYGLQAGVQSFSYAMFFMNNEALNYLDSSAGFEIGVGPSVVVVDAGVARTLTTTTLKDDVYAFIFGQQGLMAGLGLQGSKISRITP